MRHCIQNLSNHHLSTRSAKLRLLNKFIALPPSAWLPWASASRLGLAMARAGARARAGDAN